MSRCLVAMALALLASTAEAGAGANVLHAVVQAGANQGLVSAGVVGDHDVVKWGVTLGLTPSVSNDRIITQINFETGFMIYRGDDVRFLIGPALLVNSSNETFFSLPDKYPDGYYPPNAYFFAFQAALAYNNGYFLMASMLDYYFEVLARNPRGSVSNASLVSLGFGRVF